MGCLLSLYFLGLMMYNFAAVAGWSSLVARRAHNPKAVGSNPAPATKFYCVKGPHFGAFCLEGRGNFDESCSFVKNDEE
jgi:hypothetical protein